MNSEATLNKSQTDWERLETMTDEEIDFSDIPPLTESQLRAMRPTAELIPELVQATKQRITIRLDSNIIQFFRQKAADADTNYQTLINAVLRDFMVRDTTAPGLRELVREVVREELNYR
jgi:uncharacterized protein (DUF4415 family)